MSTGYNYKSNYSIEFFLGQNIQVIDIDTAEGSFTYDLDPKSGEDNHMKLTIENTTTQKVELKVETTTKESSKKVAQWFKDQSCSAAALSRESAAWPPQMRFAFMPQVTLSINDMGTTEKITWEGLTVGIDTVGRNTWWISSCQVKSKEELRILGIDIIDDICQEIKMKNGKYCRLLVSVDGTHKFKLKATIHKDRIIPV